MAARLNIKDSVAVWIEKINAVLDLQNVDGAFVNNDTRWTNTTFVLSGGKVRSGTNVLTIPGGELTLPTASEIVVGVDVLGASLTYHPSDSLPATDFIPLYVIQTNNERIVSVDDARTWAYEDSGAAADAIAEHEGKADPHQQYATDTRVDGIEGRLVDRENELDDPIFGLDRRVIYVDTIADLQALDTSKLVDGQQVQVKEYHARSGIGGGEFYWDASRPKADHDGGIVLDPDRIAAWDGTYLDIGTLFEAGTEWVGCFVRLVDSSYINVDWYGAKETEDLQPIISHVKDLGEITGSGSYTLLSGVSVGAGGIKFRGISIKADFSDTIFPIDADSEGISFDECVFTTTGAATLVAVKSTSVAISKAIYRNCIFDGFKYVFRAEEPQGTSYGELEVVGNTVSNGVGGFQFFGKDINSFIATNNFFNDMVLGETLGQTATAIAAGSNDWTGSQGRMSVTNNVFKNIRGNGGETHAILLIGNEVVVSGNIVDTMVDVSGQVKDGEAIYVKGKNATVTGNTINDGGYTSDGVLNIKGGGDGCVCSNNSIRFSDSPSRTGNGISITSQRVICTGNYVENAPQSSIKLVATASGGYLISENLIVDGGKDQDSLIVDGGISFSVQESSKSIVIQNNLIENCFSQGIIVRLISVATGVKDVVVTGNVISMAETANTFPIRTVSASGQLLDSVKIDNNYIKRCNAAAIRAGYDGEHRNFSATRNQYPDQSSIHSFGTEFTSGLQLCNGSVASSDSGALNNNSIGYQMVRLTGASYTLYAQALPGAVFNATCTASSTGIVTSGSVFRGGFSEISLSGMGGVRFECFEEGVWDIVASVPQHSLV